MESSLRYHYSWRLIFIQNISNIFASTEFHCFTFKIFIYYGLDEDHHKLIIQSTSGQFFALFLRMDNVSHDIRMYGLHTVFLECGQLVRPPNWLGSLYGLTVQKKSVIFDVLKQKYWRSLQDNSKRSFMQYGFMILTTPHWNRITTISGSAFFISPFIIW